MPLNCTTCRFGAEIPGSLAELQTVTEVTQLGHDIEVLALLGTQLEDALITTRNGGALLSGRGGYGPLQTSDMPLRLSRRRVTLRVSPQPGLSLLRYEGDLATDLPGALAVVDGQGNVCHRVQYVSPYDTRVAQSLDPEPVAVWPERAGAGDRGNVISLAAVRQAREAWPDADTGAHLNDLLEDGGVRRQQCLPHVGREKAWRISTDIIESFFYFLNKRRTNFARMVPASGMVQADIGQVGDMRRIGNLLVLTTEKSTFSLDCNEIGSVWVVATSRHWLLEIYGRDHKAIAVLAADPMGDAGLWRNLLAALPRAV